MDLGSFFQFFLDLANRCFVLDHLDLIGTLKNFLSLLITSNRDLLCGLFPLYCLLLSLRHLLVLIFEHHAHVVAHHHLPLGEPILEELLDSYRRFVRELIHKKLVCRLDKPEVIFGIQVETRVPDEGRYRRRILQEAVVDDRKEDRRESLLEGI